MSIEVTIGEGHILADYMDSYGYSEGDLRTFNPDIGDELVAGQMLTLPEVDELNETYRDQEMALTPRQATFNEDYAETYPERITQEEPKYEVVTYDEDKPMEMQASHTAEPTTEPISTLGNTVPQKEFTPPSTAIQNDMVAEKVQMSEWLKKDEGFKLQPYGLPNDGSGVTVATGVDFGSLTPEVARAMGIPESIIGKMAPAFGVKGQYARELAPLLPELTYEEANELDRIMSAKNENDLKHEFGDRYDSMNTGEKFVANSLIHQYGLSRFRKQAAYKQLKVGDREGLRRNLANWGDTTPNVADAINTRYANVGKRVDSYLTNGQESNRFEPNMGGITVKPSILQEPSRQYADRADVDAIEPAMIQLDDLLGVGGLAKASVPLLFKNALKAMPDVGRKELMVATKPIFQKVLRDDGIESSYKSTSMIPTNILRHFTEYDRAVRPRDGHEAYRRFVDSVSKRGVDDSLILTYYPNEGKALLKEGNHRVAAAQELGIGHLPTRVVTSRYPAPDDAVKLANPPKMSGHIPADLKPTQIGISGFDLEDFFKLYKESQK